MKVFLTKEQLPPRRRLNKIIWRHSKNLQVKITGQADTMRQPSRQIFRHTDNSTSYLHNASYLLHFALPWEERIACVEFGKDATQTPHVNGHAVGVTQDDLWRAVEATLNVGVH